MNADSSDGEYTHADNGGTMIRMGREDAAVIWRAESGGWEMALPKKDGDEEAPEAVVALTEALLLLSDGEERAALARAFEARSRT